MPSDRAGYTLTIYCIDVSPSMGEEKVDPGLEGSKGKGKGKNVTTKLDLVKEYVARRCEPKISSGRKTEAVGIVSFGGETNNQANKAYVEANPEDEDPIYANVACDVAAQTVKPKTVEVVMNLDLGEQEGNPVSAVMVALDMIHTHKHTKSWALEVVLLTDGESAFIQDEYEDAMARLDEMGVKLEVIGVDFQDPSEAVDKSKTRNKRLSEKFWRTFVEMLNEKLSQTTSSDEILPELGTFEKALEEARRPKPGNVNSAVSPIELRIGSSEVDPDQAIVIPIRYSKATMKARPPSLSKAWKPAMDLQGPTNKSGYGPSSQLLNSLQQQSQSQGGQVPSASDLAAIISADVKHFSTYVIKKEARDPTAALNLTQGEKEDMEGMEIEDEELEDEEAVAKEDIVKAWRFGSTWVPMEADTFEPLETQKGVEVLGFVPQDSVKRHLLMGEVRFMWPDLTSPKAQIQFSSLVEGMTLRGMCAIVRWVLRDRAEPVLGVCIPQCDFPGDDKRLDFMFWIQLPFAEDEHNFWFPTLTEYKTSAGKVITEHPLIPTDEQCKLMDKLVEGMDLDEYALKQAKADQEANGDGDEDMDGLENARWYQPGKSYNPVIHRIKEAIFHASLSRNLEQDPLGPPHPELTKYFESPDEVTKSVEKVSKQLKDKLSLKKVPTRQRRKIVKEGLREDEGYIDIDDLFGAPSTSKAKVEPVTPLKKGIKSEPASAKKANNDATEDQGVEAEATPQYKPKRGRLVSNEAPLQDFERLIEGEGDVFRKAIQDLGAVVKENIEASFSKSAYALAIECLKAMRSTALAYEEVETYNAYLDDLEAFVTNPEFKHKGFWTNFEKAGDEVGKISEEEAKAALEGGD